MISLWVDLISKERVQVYLNVKKKNDMKQIWWYEEIGYFSVKRILYQMF